MEHTSDKKRIIYIGNFEPYFSTENDIKKSFEKLGWDVFPIQESKMNEDTVKEIIKIQKGFAFLLYTRTWARTDKLYRMVLKDLKIPSVSVHLDLYIGLERGKDLKQDSFWLSDYVFSADGGHQVVFKTLGINHFFFPPAILEDSVYLGKKTPKYVSDVAFCGAVNYHKEWRYRPRLVKWLQETYGTRFKLWGATELVRGDDLNNLYASAKVIMGDSTYSPNYWSDRIPETIGRGGFLIHPFVEDIEKNFTPFKHFIPYYHGDFKTLKEIIDWYIAHDKERDEIRLAGMQHVKEHHTYTERAKYIIETLKNYEAI